jgi:hypothetical protein
MTIAAVAPPSRAATRSLPPLGGGLLFAYRCIWLLLAAAAAAILAWLAVEPDMSPLILALRLAKGVILLAVSLILLRRRTEDPVAALLALALLLWTITSSFDLATGELPTAIVVADRLRFLLFALALLLFPASSWSPGWTRIVAAVSAGVFLLGLAEALGIASTRLFLPLAIACILISLAALLARYRDAENEQRQQVKWVALGLVTGISLIIAARAGAALRDLQDQPMLDALLVEGLLQFGIVVIALGFLVSLLRYRLYDAETVISRSAAYAGLTLALVGTFAASETLIQTLGQRYFGPQIGDLSGGIAAAIAAILRTPLNNRISNWAEQRFQRDLAALKEQLPELLAELSGIATPALVGEAVLGRIEMALDCTRTALILDGRVIATTQIDATSTDRWLEICTPTDPPQLVEIDGCSPFSLRMPLHCPFGALRGWLLLGPRPDGSRFSSDDLDAITAIAPALKRALFAAKAREIEREQDLAQQRSIMDALHALQNRIAAIEIAKVSN